MNEEGKMGKELLKKAKEAKTVEELKALASQNNFDMDDDEAEKYFAHLHSNETLSDDELGDISGGACRSKHYYYKRCPRCQTLVKVNGIEGGSWWCSNCGYHYMN